MSKNETTVWVRNRDVDRCIAGRIIHDFLVHVILPYFFNGTLLMLELATNPIRTHLGF
jgi:hypothetical protein